jgi:hypothetical protein
MRALLGRTLSCTNAPINRSPEIVRRVRHRSGIPAACAGTPSPFDALARRINRAAGPVSPCWNMRFAEWYIPITTSTHVPRSRARSYQLRPAHRVQRPRNVASTAGRRRHGAAHGEYHEIRHIQSPNIRSHCKHLRGGRHARVRGRLP